MNHFKIKQEESNCCAFRTVWANEPRLVVRCSDQLGLYTTKLELCESAEFVRASYSKLRLIRPNLFRMGYIEENEPFLCKSSSRGMKSCFDEYLSNLY